MEVGKSYRLYRRRSERLLQILFRRWGRSYGREFRALSNVSLAVREGQCVGVVGPNGSGKSTLLQLIAGTLRPSTGTIAVNGRVAALLELGSGFDVQFTGRENVYLNAALFGVTRRQMAERFAEVAEFAGIGSYIDQPVKFYSSGMVVRLAFAVQTIVPKEVLIVDEALSVGDEAFQRKCIRAIERFIGDGGTVLLVSHNMQTVIRLCSRCILLVEGEVLADGEPRSVANLYQKLLYGSPEDRAATLRAARTGGSRTELAKQPERSASAGTISDRDKGPGGRVDWQDEDLEQPGAMSYGNGAARITDVGFVGRQGERVDVLCCGLSYELQYTVLFLREVSEVGFGMSITTPEGILVDSHFSTSHMPPLRNATPGSRVRARFKLRLNLAPGVYYLNVGVASLEGGDRVFLQRRTDVLSFRVHDANGRAGIGIAYMDPAFDLVEVSPLVVVEGGAEGVP
jgi:lipopolysaccharide transport system ATP-binding protein